MEKYCTIIHHQIKRKYTLWMKIQIVTSSHIVFFSEIWLTQDYPNDKLQMQNFSLHCIDNLHSSHHGMIVYIHKDIPVQCMHKISNCDLEAIKLETLYNDNILTIIGLNIQQQVPQSRIQTSMRKIFTSIPDKNMW